MVGRVTRCMHRRNRRVPCCDCVAGGNGRPRHTPSVVTLRPRHLEKPRTWHSLRNRRGAGRMVGVTVCDDDLRKFVAVQCGGKRIEVARVSDARIYERRARPRISHVQLPSPVICPGLKACTAIAFTDVSCDEGIRRRSSSPNDSRT